MNFESGSTVLGVPVPAGLAALTNPFVAFALGLSIILILLAYTIMTAQYIMILVQMYFYLAVAPLLLSFGALAQGRDLAMKVISGGLAIGMRLLAIYFVLAVANGMAPTIGAELAVAGIDNMGPIWAAVGLSALLALLAIKVPTLASDILGGSASLSGADMFAPAAVGASVGTAVTNGLTQVMEKYFGQLGSGAGSIAAAGESGALGVNSPASYVTAAQQAAATSAPPGGPDYGYGSSASASSGVPTRADVDGSPSLSLSEVQARHDQKLGFTPNESTARETGPISGEATGGSDPQNTSAAQQASGDPNPAPGPSSVGIGGALPDGIQNALQDLAHAEQTQPVSVHFANPDDHEKEE
jgi:type IV secretion system protein TrbL